MELTNEFASCLLQFSSAFMVAGSASCLLLALYIIRTQKLKAKAPLQAGTGTKSIRRTWKVNLLHLLSLIFPFVVVFVLTRGRC